ncbi:uncharacterized protein LOC102629700 isoform X2 [Citrus sinensis]|uniref:uncharacterized protein LOC102629700 isoform X2 n=1 Tax=Citrus sinensis TaxID=2711 RepID=UPI002279E4A1|nr:uncharacterized protein LOC102629700 isoform X2 [Citrus sinensis]
MSSIVKKRKSRGRTNLPQLVRNRNNGQKLIVEYNKIGQPHGKVATRLFSFLGVLARTMVRISYEDWSKVPSETKEKIWECIKFSFEVDDELQGKFLSSAANKWRTFKNRLTTKYIKRYKDKPEALKCPPKMYDFIEQEDWEVFVRYRTSSAFEEISQKYRERRAKNIYNHCLSRKGYVGLKEELQQAAGNNEEISRSTLWKAARKNKKGRYTSEVVREKADEIDEITKKSEEGVIATGGRNDVLTIALGTPESSGRVRTGGRFATPSSYFGRKKRSFSSNNELQERITQLEENYEKISQEKFLLEQNVGKIVQEQMMHFFEEFRKNGVLPIQSPKVPSEKGSCSEEPRMKKKCSKKKQVHMQNECFKKKQGKSCMLAVGSINNIVAKGTMLENNDPNSTVHGVPLAVTDVRVAVDIAIKGDTFLPRPVRDELVIVSHAIGSHVAWPKQFVILNDFEEYKVPARIDALCKYARRVLTKALFIEIYPGIFNNEQAELYLSVDDIVQFCSMEKIGVATIICYMKHLYEVLKDRPQEHIYKFGNPSILCDETGNNDETRARAMVSRMEILDPQQLLMFPYNTSKHWMLIVVDPHKFIVYFFDSLGHEPRPDLKNFVSLAFKIFVAKMGNANRKSFVWKRVKCPQQTTNTECGYYVMRFMKEIIENQTDSIKNLFVGRDSFTQKDIDKVRVEWAEYIWQNIFR